MEQIHEQTIEYVRTVFEYLVRAIRTRNEQDLTAKLGQRINVFFMCRCFTKQMVGTVAKFSMHLFHSLYNWSNFKIPTSWLLLVEMADMNTVLEYLQITINASSRGLRQP